MPRTRTRITTTLAATLLIPLQRGSGSSLRNQLTDHLRAAARTATLPPGATLPSSRQLADDLGVSRGVVVNAYEQLVAEGYLIARPRGGVRVASAPGQGAAQPAAIPAPETFPLENRSLRYDLVPAVPDPALFPRGLWVTALRDALKTLPDSNLSYGDRRGSVWLRVELAGYLARVRGVMTAPEHIVLCSGFAQGLRLVCQVCQRRGMTQLAMEDPSHPSQRLFTARTGMALVPIPVDEEGLRVDALTASGARLVVVTPAHQFPLGVAMSPARRTQLIAWARACDGWIVEDDYDAEFRYDRAPIGALQGLAPDRVIYASSVSKTLAPALRLGWLAAPPELADALSWEKAYADLGSSLLDQVAYGRLLATGALDRHLRKVRRLYRERRDMLARMLPRCLPGAEALGIAAGLHCVITLPAGMDEGEVVERARAAGVGVYGLRNYYARPDAHGWRPALVIGYGALPLPGMIAGMTLLGEVVLACANAAR